LAGRNKVKQGQAKTGSKGKVPGKVRYAVVGLGYISQIAVLPAFSHARENSELRALVTGDAEKAKRLSKKYQAPLTYSYENYHACLESGEIDAVYIALPNSMHHAYSVGAAKAGVHVLCEKPMALSEEECQGMIDAAEDNKVKLMIAYRLHFEKANLQAVETVQTGKLGEPRLFHSTFTMQVRKDNIRLKSDLGGGPLWDIGIYCINAARYLFRAEPEEVSAFRVEGRDARFGEVEEAVSAILRFPGDVLATFSCSFGASDVGAYEVVGTKGSLRADPAYEYAEKLKLKITIDEKSRERIFPKSDQFAPELLYFSDCVLNNKDPEPSGREGLADVRVIRALYESFELGKPVAVKSNEAVKRPDVKQEIRRPAIAKPDVIHIQSPTAD
jgi:glucose-fructose oxidoreductase